mgnify:CR=1 FL=1
MLKKLLFLGLLILISVNFNYVLAETNLIIPLKKPSLSDNEIKDKISYQSEMDLDIKLQVSK